jgi:hypothetical protein
LHASQDCQHYGEVRVSRDKAIISVGETYSCSAIGNPDTDKEANSKQRIVVNFEFMM